MEWDSDPEAAVTVTVKDPAEDELTVRVEVPVLDGDMVTLAGLKLAALLVVVRVTTPLKPLMLVNVKVVELEKPACTVNDREPPAMAKSRGGAMITDIVAEWGDPPPIPVTVTVYEPIWVLLLEDMVTTAVAIPPGSSPTGFALNDIEIPG